MQKGRWKRNAEREIDGKRNSEREMEKVCGKGEWKRLAGR